LNGNSDVVDVESLELENSRIVCRNRGWSSTIRMRWVMRAGDHARFA